MAGEKTEEPTEQKLEKAREEGNFSKSQELSSAVVYGVVVMTLVGSGNFFMDQFRELIRVGLDFSPGSFSNDAILLKMHVVMTCAIWLMFPLALVAAAAGILGMVGQIGFHVSFKPVTPKFDNISPAKGIKKIFSIKSVMELLQMFVRASIIGLLSWWLIRSALSLFASAAYQPLQLLGATAWHLVTRLLELALLCFLILSAVDYALQRWQFMKGQRMSKDEVKREYKESEGDPIVKSARMQFGRELVNSSGSGGQKHAKVILTNPTHYAVAVAYDAIYCSVPTIIAKGADLEAKKIREEAAVLGIPIMSNPPLARALYKLPLNSPIPRQYFGVISAVLLWLDRIAILNDCQLEQSQEPGGAA